MKACSTFDEFRAEVSIVVKPREKLQVVCDELWASVYLLNSRTRVPAQSIRHVSGTGHFCYPPGEQLCLSQSDLATQLAIFSHC